MLSCKKATLLIEKKSILPLSLKENIQLKMHKSMCNACKAYEIQSQKIDTVLKTQSTSDMAKIDFHENKNLKEKILKNLSSEQ